MKHFKHIKRDERGAGAVEFALAAPVLFTIVIGIAQMGALFFTNTEVQHAVEEAARKAATYPTPTDAEIIDELNASRFGDGGGTKTPSVKRDKAADDMQYIEISMSYTVPLNFIFFSMDPVTVSHTRRVFTQQDTPKTPPPATPPTPGTGTPAEPGPVVPDPVVPDPVVPDPVVPDPVVTPPADDKKDKGTPPSSSSTSSSSSNGDNCKKNC